MGALGRTRDAGRLTGDPATRDRPRVVVVGAGFGGLWTARTLADEDVDVLLIDRNNYHTFFPLLYQVAAAELVPTDIAHPVRAIFRRAPNVEFRMTEMTGLDLDGRIVHTADGDVPYDQLVLALGSVPHYFGVEGAAEHAFPLRWMTDAVPLRHHLLTRFEEASLEDDPAHRRRHLTFTVVGGGPTGVEYAGALAELVYGPLRRDYRALVDDVQIQLIEATDRLLGAMPEHLGRYAERRLVSREVNVRLGVSVERVEAEVVHLSGGETLPTETVVWTAGIQGDPRAADWGLPIGKGGRVPVTPELYLEDRPEVFVIGDLALLTDADGKPLPQVAQVAIQQGRHVGKTILRRCEGEEAEPFRYRDPGMMAVIGRSAAVAHVFGRSFKGIVAWLLWLVIHIAWLVGFRNRVLVFLNWAWNYVFFDRAVRLVLSATGGRDPERLAAGIEAMQDSNSTSDSDSTKDSS